MYVGVFCLLAAAGVLGADQKETMTPAAEAAMAEYNRELDRIDADATNKKTAALAVVLRKLEDAQKAATKAENLDAAVTIREKRRQLLAAAGPSTQPAERPSGAAPVAASKDEFFQGMLGKYKAGDQALPIVLLGVPNGSNVLSDVAKRAVARANVDVATLTFEARGLLVIPHDGAYGITGSRALSFEIDGKIIDLANYNKRHGVEVRLTKGPHEVVVRVGNNGGQLGESFIDIINVLNGRPVPLIVRAFDAEQHLQPSSANPPDEVSSWLKRRVRVEVPKALQPVAPKE